MKKRRFRQLPGVVVRVELENGKHGYGQFLGGASYAFFDYCGDEDLPLHRIGSLRIVFMFCVQACVTDDPNWSRIGRLGKYSDMPTYFIQDALAPDQIELYRAGVIRKASRAEAIGLERVVAWSPDNARQRLIDHFAGRPNPQAELMKLK